MPTIYYGSRSDIVMRIPFRITPYSGAFVLIAVVGGAIAAVIVAGLFPNWSVTLGIHFCWQICW